VQRSESSTVALALPDRSPTPQISPALGMADQHARVPLDLDPLQTVARRASPDHREIASKCQFHRRQRLSRRRDESFAG